MNLESLEKQIAALSNLDLIKLQAHITRVLEERDPEWQALDQRRPRMTRKLAEERAISGGKGQFDSVAFLRTLKK